MNKRILAVIATAVITMTGCSTSDTLDTSLPYEPSGDAISFNDTSLPVGWTRGVALGDTNFDEMELFAYYTGQKNYAQADIIEKFMNSQRATKNLSGDWEYSPKKYWPNNTGDKVSFYAFAPYGAIECTDNQKGKPLFDYTMSQNTSENGDLMAAAPLFNRTKEANGATGVTFEFDHLLTRIMLKGAIDNMPTAADSKTQGEANVRFYINGITFYNINSKARASYNNDKGVKAWEWSTPTTPINCTAMQGHTLIAHSTAGAELEATPKSVMMDDDTAIFMLPQDVTSGTLQVRVRKVYDTLNDDGTIKEEDCEMIYATSKNVTIPTPDDCGVFNASEWINMTFTFDAGDLKAYDTPMTISSEVYDWTEADVDVDVHHNIYIYSSKSNIVAETDSATGEKYGDFEICTNYDFNLRVPHYRVELDGKITSSRGFLFCSDDFNAYQTNDVDTVKTNYKVFMPTLLNKSGQEVQYVTKRNITPAAEAAYNKTIVYDNNGFGYDLSATGLYQLLHYDTNGNIVEFNYKYDANLKSYEIDLTEFATADDTIHFDIKIGEIDGVEHTFDFSVRRSTREAEGLYITNNDGNGISGVDKRADDAVYILRLSVNSDRLQALGKFDDIIGTEMVSNSGGAITMLFPVTLTAN